MASKGQKFNTYSNKLKNEIVSQVLNGEKSFGYLSNQYGISKGTIKTWVYAAKSGKNIYSDSRGRPKKEEDVDYKEKYEILKNYQAFLKAQREKK